MSKIGDFFRSLFRRSRRRDYSMIRTEQHPPQENVERGIVYVIVNGGHAKWAYLRCPCPQHDVIRLNLSKQKRPAWTVRTKRNDAPDIFPSIWQLDGCYSHFWIRDGNVVWAKGSGSPPKKTDHSEQFSDA